MSAKYKQIIIDGVKVNYSIYEGVKPGETVLYLAKPRSNFSIERIVSLLKELDCNIVGFNTSIKLYKLKDLEGKENWDELEQAY